MSVICAANILAKQTKLYTSCAVFVIFYDPDNQKMKLFFERQDWVCKTDCQQFEK